MDRPYKKTVHISTMTHQEKPVACAYCKQCNPQRERMTKVYLYAHKNKLFGSNSYVCEAINHPVTAGMTQHVAYFLLGTLKGQAAVHRSLLMYSLAMITSCHSHVGGQFVSTGPQSRGPRPRNLSALSANCFRVVVFFFF